MDRLKFSFLALTALFIGSISHHTHAQDWLKDTCELNGTVKSVHSISNVYFDSDYTEWYEDIREYNQQGYLVKRDLSSSRSGKHFNAYYRVYTEEGDQCVRSYYIQRGDTASHTKFYFHKSGRISTSKRYNWGHHWNTILYTYNEQGMIIQKRCETEKGSLLYDHYEYDENDRMTLYKDLSSTSRQYTYWTYDSNGLVIEKKFLDTNMASRTNIYMGSDGERDSSSTEDFSKKPYTENSYILQFVYDEKGQLNTETKTDLEGKLISKAEFEYNTQGDRAKRVYFDAEKNEKWTDSYQYEYDSFGNWTKRTTVSDEEIIQEDQREIIYF